MGYIVDKNIPISVIKKLSQTDSVYVTKEIENMYFPVNSHPDIQLHFLEKNYAFCLAEVYDYYREILPSEIKLSKISGSAGCGYPDNVKLNIAVFGKKVVCNEKYASDEVLDYYRNNNYKIISVKQGYAKCNICIVSENAVITEDKGIYNTLTEFGVDMCLISKGYVSLKNFEYGFIGGASGLIEENTLGFIGSIELHPDYNKFKDFLNKYNVNHVSLTDGGLCDFGSILKF